MTRTTSALPLPPREVPVNRNMDALAPRFRAKVERVLARMRAAGFTPMVFEGVRTNERQTFLYGFGRDYDDGRGIVTRAETAADSWHFYGLAVDIVCARKQWDAPSAFWTTLRMIAEEEGLTSGSDWDRDPSTPERQPDAPHVQWFIPGMFRRPSAHAAELKANGGNAAVWAVLRAA